MALSAPRPNTSCVNLPNMVAIGTPKARYGRRFGALPRTQTRPGRNAGLARPKTKRQQVTTPSIGHLGTPASTSSRRHPISSEPDGQAWKGHIPVTCFMAPPGRTLDEQV